MNDWLFVAMFLTGLGLSLNAERKEIRKATAPYKWLYYGFALLCVVMLVVYFSGVMLPLPAQWLAQHVAPLVERQVKGGLM